MSDPTPHAAEPPAAPHEITPHEPTLVEATPFKESGIEEARPGAEAPDPIPPAPANRRGMGPMPVIYAIGFIIIVVALVWLWRHPNRDGAAPAAQQTAAIATTRSQLEALAQQVQDLSARVTTLENRPAAAAQPTQPPSTQPAPDLAPLEARIAALENRRPAPSQAQPDTVLQAQLAALADRVNQLSQQQSGTGDLATRLDSLARAQQSSASDLSRRLDAVASQAAASQHETAQLNSLADTAQRTARLQAASAALAAGQPLGTIPNAPPPLARFADAAPPTEAALRLSFPQAATAAERASRPDLQGKPFLTRLWLRAEQAVTIREEDRVIIGDPASGIIARARRALDAGDLAGAVATLGNLNGPAATAMSGWLGQARALLAARAALASMATSG